MREGGSKLVSILSRSRALADEEEERKNQVPVRRLSGILKGLNRRVGVSKMKRSEKKKVQRIPDDEFFAIERAMQAAERKDKKGAITRISQETAGKRRTHKSEINVSCVKDFGSISDPLSKPKQQRVVPQCKHYNHYGECLQEYISEDIPKEQSSDLLIHCKHTASGDF